MEKTILTLRKARNMKPEELSEKSGIALPYLHGIEAGRNKHVSQITVARLADAFEVNSSELMSLVELKEKGADEEHIVNAYKAQLENKQRMNTLASKLESFKVIAKSLKVIRVAEDKSVEDVADGINSYVSMINAYEQGMYKPPIEIVCEYTKYLNISTQIVFELFELEAQGATFEDMLEAYLCYRKQG